MTLGDVIKNVNPQGHLLIYCRIVVEGIDFSAGICRYEDGNLLSLDGNNYSLDDEIYKYGEGTAATGEKMLTVWYK